jgi:hypothetical protein
MGKKNSKVKKISRAIPNGTSVKYVYPEVATFERIFKTKVDQSFMLGWNAARLVEISFGNTRDK